MSHSYETYTPGHTYVDNGDVIVDLSLIVLRIQFIVIVNYLGRTPRYLFSLFATFQN